MMLTYDEIMDPRRDWTGFEFDTDGKDLVTRHKKVIHEAWSGNGYWAVSDNLGPDPYGSVHISYLQEKAIRQVFEEAFLLDERVHELEDILEGMPADVDEAEAMRWTVNEEIPEVFNYWVKYDADGTIAEAIVGYQPDNGNDLITKSILESLVEDRIYAEIGSVPERLDVLDWQQVDELGEPFGELHSSDPLSRLTREDTYNLSSKMDEGE